MRQPTCTCGHCKLCRHRRCMQRSRAGGKTARHLTDFARGLYRWELHTFATGQPARALIPISNKTQFASLPEDVVERLDLVFYGDVDRAVLKAVED